MAQRSGAAPADFLTHHAERRAVTAYEAGDAGDGRRPPRATGSAWASGASPMEYRPQNPDGSAGPPVRSGLGPEGQPPGLSDVPSASRLTARPSACYASREGMDLPKRSDSSA